jgi:hypothetical protein
VRDEFLVRLLDGALCDACGHGDVAHGLVEAGALHDHVADGGGDGLGVAAHVEAVLEPARGLLRGAHLLVAHAEAGAEAAEVVCGAHDADVHDLAVLLAEDPLDDGGELADVLLGGDAGAGGGGELLVRARLALVAARDVEAGGEEDVALLAARALPGLVHPLVHLLGAVPDGGHEAEAVGHVGYAVERLDERRLGVELAAEDAHPRERNVLGPVVGAPAGVDDAGEERGVLKEGVVGAANAAGVAVLAAAVVGEVAPLGALVDVVRLEDERALGADGVAGRVVQHHLRGAAAVRAEVLRGAVHGGRLSDLRFFLFGVEEGGAVVLFDCEFVAARVDVGERQVPRGGWVCFYRRVGRWPRGGNGRSC